MSKEIKYLIQGPDITEIGVVARVAKFVDGTIELQRYSRNNGWERGGIDVQSLLTAEVADEDILERMEFTPEQIAEILADTDKEAPPDI